MKNSIFFLFAAGILVYLIKKGKDIAGEKVESADILQMLQIGFNSTMNDLFPGKTDESTATQSTAKNQLYVDEVDPNLVPFSNGMNKSSFPAYDAVLKKQRPNFYVNTSWHN